MDGKAAIHKSSVLFQLAMQMNGSMIPNFANFPKLHEIVIALSDSRRQTATFVACRPGTSGHGFYTNYLLII